MKNKVLLFYGMFSDDQSYAYIPWSLMFLVAHLEKNHYEPIIIDEFSISDIEAFISEHAKETILFGVSAMTGRQVTSGLRAINIFRKYNKEAKVAFGGAHSTALPEETLEHDLINYVFAGQSFLSLPSLLDNMDNGNGRDIKRVIYSEYPAKEALLDFPVFNLDKNSFSKYINPSTKLLNYCAGIGCPGSCSFCSWGGRHNRYSFSVERIVDDIATLAGKYNLTTVLIQDSTFFNSKETVLTFAEELLRKDIRIFWRADARVVELNRFTRDNFKLLANSGLDWLFVGLENTVPRIMRMFNKVYHTEMIDSILGNLKGFDIDLFASMIFGVPTETIDELLINKKNIERWLRKSDNFYCQKCIFTPYPGTPLTGLAVEHGFRKPESLEEWAGHPLFVDTTRSLENHRIWLNTGSPKKYFEILKKIAADRSSNNTLKPAGTKPGKYT